MSSVYAVQPVEKEIRVLKLVGPEDAVTVPLTWERIVELEPGVLVLLEKVKAERPNWKNLFQIWMKYREELSALVGWRREDATHPELRSTAAFNLAQDKLLNSLREPEKQHEPIPNKSVKE
jgi:hypothetical protein